jgi:hypothetical protein
MVRKKQAAVVVSSTESEYTALLHVLQEQIWIHRPLTGLDVDLRRQTAIFTDSQSAIALTNNPELHMRTRTKRSGIDIQYHFVRESGLHSRCESTLGVLPNGGYDYWRISVWGRLR